jgi:hypothetical protein
VKRTLRVTLEVDVVPLEGDELEQACFGLDEVMSQEEAEEELRQTDANAQFAGAEWVDG